MMPAVEAKNKKIKNNRNLAEETPTLVTICEQMLFFFYLLIVNRTCRTEKDETRKKRRGKRLDGNGDTSIVIDTAHF